MRCPSCGSIGAPDARFCARCGQELPDDATDDTADEPGSGPPSGAGGAGGDRRIVTALFADLVDYVRMLAEPDPEVVRELVMAALATMAEAIERLGGTR